MSDEQQPDKIDILPARKRGGPLSPDQRVRKQARFLNAYRETGNIRYSCQVAGVSRQAYYDWRDHDEAFKAELPDAIADAHDTLELAAYERAVKGVESYVVSMGRIVYEEIPEVDGDGNPKLNKKGDPIVKRGNPVTERKYSDTLLATLLKANMPEKYRERTQVEHSGPGGGPIQIQRNPNLKNLSDEELDALENLAKKAVGEGDSGDNS